MLTGRDEQKGQRKRLCTERAAQRNMTFPRVFTSPAICILASYQYAKVQTSGTLCLHEIWHQAQIEMDTDWDGYPEGYRRLPLIQPDHLGQDRSLRYVSPVIFCKTWSLSMALAKVEIHCVQKYIFFLVSDAGDKEHQLQALLACQKHLSGCRG